MLDALLAFGLARLLGRPFVHAVLAKRDWQTPDDWVARHGWGAVLVSRFIPVISFNLINYAAGLTRIPWWTFTWATAVGILPLTTLMVVLADRLQTLPWQVGLVVFVMGLLLWRLMRRIFRQQENRQAGTPTCPRSDSEQALDWPIPHTAFRIPLSYRRFQIFRKVRAKVSIVRQAKHLFFSI